MMNVCLESSTIGSMADDLRGHFTFLKRTLIFGTTVRVIVRETNSHCVKEMVMSWGVRAIVFIFVR